MWTEIVALMSVLIAVGALLLTLWQNILTRRSVQAEVFLTLENYALEQNYDEGISAIINLPVYESYEEFCMNESEDIQKSIYRTVKFLSYAAHIASKKFLPRQHIWDRYFYAYRISHKKLFPWWMEGIRGNYNPYRFATFEEMCNAAAEVSEEAIIEWDRKHGRRTPQAMTLSESV